MTLAEEAMLAKGSDIVRISRGEIADRLRDEVLSGRIEPGQFLRQEDLGARFCVSRTPVREALLQLTHEGLLEAVPNTGVKVRHYPPDHIQRFLTPLRRTIEIYALELCFDSLDDEDFQRWDAILENLRKACEQRDYHGMAEFELAFHRSILQRAADPTLLNIWSSIVSQVAAYLRKWHKKYADPLDNYREHAQIVATFRSGDKEASLELYSERIGDHHTIRQLGRQRAKTKSRLKRARVYR